MPRNSRPNPITARLRSLLTPFTDNVDLTPADRRAYTSYAEAERHKGFQKVDVDFDRPPAKARTETRRSPVD